MHSLDSTKLYELAKELAPEEPSLVEEVRMAVEDPNTYVERFHERLGERGIHKPGPELPWIALVDGLVERGLAVEFMKGDDARYVMSQLETLFGYMTLGCYDVLGDWDISEEQEEMPCEEFLPLVARQLQRSGLALVYLDMQSDRYPVLVVPLDRLERIQRLARESGYGKIIKAEELLE